MKKLVFMFSILIVLAFTACTSIDGDLEKKSNVDKKVKAEVVDEAYRFVTVEHHEDERPKRDVYIYESKERDMTFEVVSTLRPIDIDGAVLGYSRYVDVQYEEAVQGQYEAQKEEILKGFDRDDSGRLLYDSFDELEEIAEAIIQLNDVYQAELQYNTAEWMVEHPLCTIGFCHERPDYPGFYNGIFEYDINCTYDYDYIYDYITYKHAEAVTKGELIDDTTPQEQLARVHAQFLEHVRYNGMDLSAKAYEKAREDGLYNNLESGYYSYYYYPWDTYLILVDCGLTNEDYAPKLMEAYADALGFYCDVKYKKGEIDWSYGGSDYKITASTISSRRFKEFHIYKDGTDLNVPYVAHDTELSPVGATYVVGIPVDVFAELFDLDYEIDEVRGSVDFTEHDALMDEINALL